MGKLSKEGVAANSRVTDYNLEKKVNEMKENWGKKRKRKKKNI